MLMSLSIKKTEDNLVNKIQVELSSNTLIQLLNAGLIHYSDCKSLNATTKQVLWQALLTSSGKLALAQEEQLCA